jgi:hypothetical protein
VVPVVSAICNRAKKSLSAPGVLMVLAACANAKIDRCECQTNTKNARSLIAKATTKISGSELMTQILSVRACRRDRAGRLDHDGVRICDALSNVGTPRAIASLPTTRRRAARCAGDAVRGFTSGCFPDPIRQLCRRFSSGGRLGECRSALFKNLRGTSAAASGQTLRGSAARDIALR